MITLEYIDHGHGFDWGRASGDYGHYRDIYPASFYEKMAGLRLCTQGQRVLDVGTGTGVLPRGMYGHGASFTGIDISPGQVAVARRLSAERGMDIEYRVAAAEELPFADASFDVVLAAMCFFYLDERRALPEIHRVLAPGGRLCIISMMWLPQEDLLTSASEELVLKYNPHWTGAGYVRRPPEVPAWAQPRPGAPAPLFAPGQALAWAEKIPFTHDGWLGRFKACRGMGASSLGDEQIAAFETDLAGMLLAFEEPLLVPHYLMVEVFDRI